jgi:hypothetical protein
VASVSVIGFTMALGWEKVATVMLTLDSIFLVLLVQRELALF